MAFGQTGNQPEATFGTYNDVGGAQYNVGEVSEVITHTSETIRNEGCDYVSGIGGNRNSVSTSVDKSSRTRDSHAVQIVQNISVYGASNTMPAAMGFNPAMSFNPAMGYTPPFSPQPMPAPQLAQCTSQPTYGSWDQYHHGFLSHAVRSVFGSSEQHCYQRSTLATERQVCVPHGDHYDHPYRRRSVTTVERHVTVRRSRQFDPYAATQPESQEQGWDPAKEVDQINACVEGLATKLVTAMAEHHKSLREQLSDAVHGLAHLWHRHEEHALAHHLDQPSTQEVLRLRVVATLHLVLLDRVSGDQPASTTHDAPMSVVDECLRRTHMVFDNAGISPSAVDTVARHVEPDVRQAMGEVLGIHGRLSSAGDPQKFQFVLESNQGKGRQDGREIAWKMSTGVIRDEELHSFGPPRFAIRRESHA